MLFRGELSGEVGCLDAFCPHLGTHLGHGGTVENDNVVCPYHKWKFDTKGQCKDIPYCPSSRKVVGKSRVNTRSYHVRERLGMIFVWIHVENKDPSFEGPKLCDEIDAPGSGFYQVDVVNFEDFHMHVMEPSQNTADWYHFLTVHGWLPVWLCGKQFLKATHKIEAHYGGGVSNSTYGTSSPPENLMIRERVVALKLFGFIPLPVVFAQALETEVHMNGNYLVFTTP